jgi:hypothetical protein
MFNYFSIISIVYLSIQCLFACHLLLLQVLGCRHTLGVPNEFGSQNGSKSELCVVTTYGERRK